MKIKEILEKEFGGDVKVYDIKDFYTFYVYKPNGMIYFFLFLRKMD